MAERRPIDILRDSAKSGRIGGDDDDSAISDMIPIDDTMYFVKERGIYAMQLALTAGVGSATASCHATDDSFSSKTGLIIVFTDPADAVTQPTNAHHPHHFHER
jgi:hypothetical protein